MKENKIMNNLVDSLNSKLSKNNNDFGLKKTVNEKLEDTIDEYIKKISKDYEDMLTEKAKAEIKKEIRREICKYSDVIQTIINFFK